MSEAFIERQQRALLGDSVVLQAELVLADNSGPVLAADIQGVQFTVMTPTDAAGAPSVNAQAGTIPSDGIGQYVVAGTINDVDGHYRGFAKFTYTDSTLTGANTLTKSIPVSYEVVDPLLTTGASPADPYVDQAWMKLEDCFDSDLGGPWLRDMTLANFDKYKMRQFLPEAFLSINQQMPFTDYDETTFPYTANDGGALVAQSLLVSTLRHLMRSYTEQPDIMSSPVAFADRKRYQQAWATIYQIEEALFERWLTRWKLRSYDLSNASILVASKAGRYLPGALRSRNTFRGFGY